jgi:glycosyltransferase involved in cell wall biosynthesis
MITAVIPCYNAGKYLGEAVASVRRQTMQVDEIIVVDDCSTDGSIEVARALGTRVLQTESNIGHAAARNIGSEAANGELIAWLDADDYWEPNHIEVVTGLLARYSEAAVAFSAVRFVGRLKEGVWRHRGSGAPENMFWSCLNRTIVPAMSVVTRRSVLRAAGGFDPTIRVAPDFDLWLRLSRHHLFVNTPEVTSNYRWHEAQISRQPDKQLESLYAARWRYLQRARGVDDDEFLQRLEDAIVSIWEADLLKAWHGRDLPRLRLLLRMQRHVPRSTPIAKRMALRSRLPRVLLKVWDAMT